jgi:ATP-binding cassette subfamily B (MDR/TAP) protein 7
MLTSANRAMLIRDINYVFTVDYVCVHFVVNHFCLTDGIARATSSLLSELRGVVFSKVVQHSIRDIANKTFTHLLNLDLSFHLQRNTGALNRSIDRGTRSLNFILSALTFNVVPTIAEIGLVLGVLTYNFGFAYSGVAVATLGAYIAFTVAITSWR